MRIAIRGILGKQPPHPQAMVLVGIRPPQRVLGLPDGGEPALARRVDVLGRVAVAADVLVAPDKRVPAEGVGVVAGAGGEGEGEQPQGG